MLNKLLAKRLQLNIAQQDIADKANVSLTLINRIENGTYPIPTVITNIWDRVSEAYDMNTDELIKNIKSNNKYRNNNNKTFLSELHNKIYIRKPKGFISRNTNKDYSNKKSKELFYKAIDLGFYNTADRTACNKYCRENNIESLTADEWHIIKKQIEDKFLVENGITLAQYKYHQSLLRCAREVGFGNDYKKYNRWVVYKRKTVDPLPIEEWSKLDDKKQISRAKNKQSREELDRINANHAIYATRKAIELGLDDAKQFYRWKTYVNNKNNKEISIKEWKKLDTIRMKRLNYLREIQAKED